MTDTVVTTTNITRTNNKYWLGKRENLGKRETSGFCEKHIVSERWEEYYNPVKGYTLTNVTYNQSAKALTLTANRTNAVKDMTLAMFTLTGSWEVTGRLNGVETGVVFLKTKSSAAATAATAETKYSVTRNGSWFCQFQRTEIPPETETRLNQTYYMENDHVRITWGAQDYVEIQYSEYATRTLKTKRRPIQESEKQAMFGTERVYWSFTPAGNGEAYIECSAWNEPYRITNIAPTAANTWKIAGSTGMFGFNFGLVTFPASGTFITPYLECGEETYADGDMLYSIYGVGGYRVSIYDMVTYWNAPSPGVASSVYASLSIYATSGTKRRYQITLYGDGWHTPFVQFWQAFFDPAISEPIPTWVEVTDQVIPDSPVENHTSDTAPSTLSLAFDNYDKAFYTYLTDHSGSDLQKGQIAIACQTGATVETTVTTTPEGGGESTAVTSTITTYHPAFLGIVTEPTDTYKLSSVQQYSVNAVDPLALLAETELVAFPCLLGSTVKDAITRLTMAAGIPFASVIDDSTDAATTYLDDPGREYNNPPWNPCEGANALDFLREVLSLGYRVEVKATDNGSSVAPGYTLNIQDNDPEVAVGCAFGVSNTAIPFEEDNASVDYGNAATHIRVIGQDADGNPVSRIAQITGISNTAGNWGFVGPRKVHVIHCPDLMSAEMVQKRLDQEIKNARRPVMKGTLTTRDETAYNLRGNDRVTVNDEDVMISQYDGATDKAYKCTSVSVKHGEYDNVVTLGLEQII